MPEGKVWQAQRIRERLPRIFLDPKKYAFVVRMRRMLPTGSYSFNHQPNVTPRSAITSSVALRARSAT